jgi:hypothetical protein
MACRVPSGNANVNGFRPDGILASHSHPTAWLPWNYQDALAAAPGAATSA